MTVVFAGIDFLLEGVFEDCLQSLRNVVVLGGSGLFGLWPVFFFSFFFGFLSSFPYKTDLSVLFFLS